MTNQGLANMFSNQRRSHLALFLPILLAACATEGEIEPGASSTGQESQGGNVAPGTAIVLIADSNRDGRVDLSGNSDLPDKMSGSKDKGALFLANLDDDASRCNAGASEASVTCFDASDEIVNGPQDAKDLAVVQTRPLSVGDNASAKLLVSKGPAQSVRVFEQLPDGSYRVVTPETSFDATKLRQGITFAVEGKDIARDKKVWDGSIHLKLEWQDAGNKGYDTVAMRVAPILSHAHTDVVERLLASPSTSAATETFRRDLEKALSDAQQPAPLYLDPNPLDLWTQDYLEPFFASIPGPDGPVSMRVLLRSNQPRKEAHLQLYTLLGPDVAVTGVSLDLTPNEPDNLRGGTYDAFGNLETIPPIPGFPAGRQVVGGSMNFEMGPSEQTMALLEAQGVQDPIWLDSSWLAVGHIDEFIAFVPSADAKLGFKVLVSDPVGTLNLLKKALEDGHGDVSMLSYKPTTAEEKALFDEAKVKNPTIAAFLAEQSNHTRQVDAEKYIAANLDILRNKIGLEDQDIVRIPSLYVEPNFPDVGDIGDIGGGFGFYARSSRLRSSFSKMQRDLALRKIQPRQDEDWAPQVGGFFPAAANMVVLPQHKNLLLAKQFGPVINGVDIIEQQLTNTIRGFGYTPRYVDDFVAYHLGEGDVHCGTNTLRAIKHDWWTP